MPAQNEKERSSSIETLIKEIEAKYGQHIEHLSAISWQSIVFEMKLTEEFIREFQDKVDWNLICSDQELSEDFIIEFRDKVNWFFVSVHQALSFDFIIENLNQVQLPWILRNRELKITPEEREKLSNLLYLLDIFKYGNA